MKNLFVAILALSLSACEIVAPTTTETKTDESGSLSKSADTTVNADQPSHAEILGIPEAETMQADEMCLYSFLSWDDGIHSYDTTVSIGTNDTWTESEAPLIVNVGLTYRCNSPMVNDKIDGLNRILADQGFAESDYAITCETNLTNEMMFEGASIVHQAAISIEFVNPAITYGGVCAK